MSIIQPAHHGYGPACAAGHIADLPASRTLLLALGAGLSVASIYYSQPMLAIMGTDLGASSRVVGFVPTLTQLGYALGVLLLAPLGDRYDRRRIILIKAGVLVAGLLGTAAWPSIGALLVCSLLVGLSATMAQDLVAAAAVMAPDQSRGKVVGTVMTGLLSGILLSRVVSGFVAEHLGWRSVYAGSALGIAVVGLAILLGLPRFGATTKLAYRALLLSMLKLWRGHAALRRATWSQGLLSLGFSAFWSTLAVMLSGEPFHFGAGVAGAFGLAGAAGALAAPVAGRLADRRGPSFVTRLGAGLAVASFALMALAAFAPPQVQIWLLVAATIGFDLGIQAALIAHQTIVYGLDADARSRLNAALMTGIFVGMAAGSALGTLFLAQWGWASVAVLGTLSSFAALAMRLRKP
ncbi:MAG: putative transporter, MFS-type [Polaromonas sp.]|nr:putative transporter, MFS-type [Polaromonas sp.]